jgi:hypothetical protein
MTGARRPSTEPLNRQACNKVLALVDQGKARIIKEFEKGKPVFSVVSVSGAPLGRPDKKFAYLFENKLAESGNGDGLFPGFHQTAGGRLMEPHSAPDRCLKHRSGNSLSHTIGA